jgi:hypothetical protein
VVSPTANITYTVAGNSSGCSVIASNTVFVAVNPLPTVSTTSAIICAGSTANISAGGANTYSWSNNASTPSISVSPSATAIYSVTGTSSLGCSGNATTQVLVVPNPTITVNSTSICAGSSASLLVSGATSYSWNTGATSTLLVLSPSVTTVYNVSGTLSGCFANTSSTITVNAPPVLSVNSTSICNGASGTLNVSGASSYSWSMGSSNSSITVSPTVSTIYSVTGISSQGCSSSATVQVSVTSAPVLSVASTSICSGGSATLLATGANTYTWTGGSNTASLVVTPSATSVYSVSGNSSGCPVTVTSTGTVIVNTPPILSVNSATICAGNSASLNVTGASTYSWSNGNTSGSNIVSPATSTIYTVTGISSQGCSSSSLASVIVNPLPSISFSLTKTVFCLSDASITLVGSPAGGNFSGSGVTGNVFNPSAAGAGSFQIAYSYTNSNTCSSFVISQVNVDACAGLPNQVTTNEIAIWPNPATERLYINNDDGQILVELYDLNGKILLAEKHSEQTVILNLSGISKGLYYVRISDEKKGNRTERIVKSD